VSEVSSKELYEFKRTLQELSEKKGRGTELVSVYIPPDRQISDVAKHMREELSQSANIKSKQTKKNVQSAIEVIMQRLKLFPRPPEKGLVMFVGMIPRGGPGTEKMETYVFEPPEPIKTYIYHCNSEFYLEPLQEMLEEKETYGLAVLDRKEATIATLKGKRIDILKTLTSGVPGKHKAGGQSQRRFDRLIDLAAHEFLKRIGDHMNEAFLQIEDLKGIILGGPGHTKDEFLNGDYLHHELKKKVITTVDTSYTGEFGIREVIDKSMDVLSEIDVMREKKLVQRFLRELINEDGLASYGEREVRNHLQMGADLMINLTSVDGFYDRDPEKHPDARFYPEITASEMLEHLIGCDVKAGTYEFFDHTAIQMIKRSGVKTLIVNGRDPENLLRALDGDIGTAVIPE